MVMVLHHLTIDGPMTQLLEEEHAASKAADAQPESDAHAQAAPAAPTEDILNLDMKEENAGAEAAVQKVEEATVVPAAAESVIETTAESAPTEVGFFHTNLGSR